MTDLDEILDDPFHGAALAAYVELAMTTGGVPDEVFAVETDVSTGVSAPSGSSASGCGSW